MADSPWRVSTGRRIKTIAGSFPKWQNRLSRNGPLAAPATFKARDREAIRHDLAEGGGIYHPAGTTRMGVRAADSVVDTQLRAHGFDGLPAVANSVKG